MGNFNSINGDAQPPTGDFKKFNDKELSRLKKVFDALYERFPYKTISFETLYKTFPLPEYLKEHLAHALDTSNAEIIDFAPMLDWLTLYCQGSMQLKMEILFRMYGLGQMVPVNQDDLEALLKALMTPISKFFTLSETSKVPSVGAKEAEYVNSMLKVIFEDHEINTDSEGKIRPEDYLDWQRENIHLVDMLERLLQNTRKKSSRRDKSSSADRSGRDRSADPERSKDGAEETDEPNDMDGFLFKVGRTFGNWHERWFVLKGKFLYGYRTERDKNYNDIIHMTGYAISKLDEKVGFYGFKLTPPESNGERSSAPKALYCKNESDRENWVQALTLAASEGVFSVHVRDDRESPWGCRMNFSSWRITQVESGGQMQKAGVKKGFRLVRVNGLDVKNHAQEVENILEKGIECDIDFTFEDGGGDEGANAKDSNAARRVSSPRASPVNRHLKKLIRQDSENKLKILQKFLYKIETTQNRVETLSSQARSLKRHKGSNGEELQNRDRKIKRLEAKVLQLETQLQFKNDFIEEMRKKFKLQVEEQKERVRKESMAMVEYRTTAAQQELQDAHERTQALQDRFQDDLFKVEGDLTRQQQQLLEASNNKINLIKVVSAEFSRLREHISELEGKLEAQKGWFF